MEDRSDIDAFFTTLRTEFFQQAWEMRIRRIGLT
jgi:hypothetical protein